MAKEPVRHLKPIRAVIRPINLAQHELEVTLELPGEALAKGADYLVIGRPITEAENPAQASQEIFTSL